MTENEQYLALTIGRGMDINYRHLVIPALDNCDALIVNIKGLVNQTELEDSVISPLLNKQELPRGPRLKNQDDRFTRLIESGISVSGAKQSQLWTEICDAIVSGDSVLFLDKWDKALILENKGYKLRNISEPTTETETRGPKDGFIEDIMSNMGLIRRRIKDYSLRFETLVVGDRSKTEIVLAYIDNLVNDSLLNEVRSRISRIKIDSLLSSVYLEEFIEDEPYSFFPTMENTERPDRAVAAILEGRVVILMDNTPFALIVPAVFWNFLQSPGDHYERYYIGTFWRWIRLVALFLALSSTSFYVLLTSFHQEMLPTALALKIAADREGVPFPAVMEAFVMELLFEVMAEAGLRMPKAIGQTVSIVGTLVIGQAAVSAGLVGPALIIAVAVGAISSFAIPSFSMSTSIRLIRFPLLFLSAAFGIFGYLGGIIFITLHLLSVRSFGTPFLGPVTPYDQGGQVDTLLRLPRWKMLTRPWAGRPKDKIRQKDDLKPRPDLK
ncbi:MAG: spore germination protein [Syntrophomonadales bacterium]